jgi:protein-disulfide isomerase
MTSRRLFQIAAGLAAAGVVLGLVLVRQHAQAHAGVASFCAINDFVNCDRVATSPYSVAFGLPVAAWGVLGYGLALLLAIAGLRRARPHATWPAGLLLAVSGAAVAASVALALVSELAIGAFCVLCAASWVVSAALLVAAWGATRPAGPARALRADLRLLAARSGRTAALVLAGAALVALAIAAYPRYWERPAPAPSSPMAAATQRAASGPPVVIEFSDYECPACALAHSETKKLLAARPDVTLVRKHFPLDPACNPAVTRSLHPDACRLAAAAICAEEQGKLGPMDDALFRNQKAKRPLDALAAEVGLDVPRLRECLGAPSTQRRLQSDIQSALAIGVRATPTFVVNGRVHSGLLTPEVLPPPAAPPARAP